MISNSSGYTINKHKHITSYFKSTLTFLGLLLCRNSIFADKQKVENSYDYFIIIKITIFNFKIVSLIIHTRLFRIQRRKLIKFSSNGIYFPKVCSLALLSRLLKYLGLLSAKLFNHAPT